jgi:hypothetical protein
MFNEYKLQRLASEFGQSGTILANAIDEGRSMAEMANLCYTRPDVFELRFNWWRDAGAPFDTPPVVVVSGGAAA